MTRWKSQVRVLSCPRKTSRSPPASPVPLPTALDRAWASGAVRDVHDRFWTAARERVGDRDGTNALIEALLAQRQLRAAAVIAGMTRSPRSDSVARRCSSDSDTTDRHPRVR